MATQKPVAIYVRVSTEGQGGEDRTSLATQMQACRDYCDREGRPRDPAHEYLEMHSGADLWERPELTRLRAAVKAGEVGAVLAYALDRLSRKQTHIAIVADECERAGVPLLFVTEVFEEGATGTFLRSAKAFAAELEREKIRERTVRGKRARLHAGKIGNYGTDLYGYRRDRERGVRVIHAGEAAVVRDIFRWVAVEGVGVKEVVRRLNDAGVPPPGTGKYAYGETRRRYWGLGSVGRMLRNPAYMGETIALRVSAAHHKPGVPHERPPEEWLHLPAGVTPPLVDRATWDAVRTRLATNHGEETRNVARPRLLRGFVFCGVCHARMSVDRSHGRDYYRCNSRATLAGPCGGKSANADALDAWAWATLTEIILKRENVAALARRAATPQTAREDARAGAVRELARIDRAQGRLLAAFEEGDDDAFPWATVRGEIERLQAERVRHAARLAAMDAAASEDAAERAAALALGEYAARVAPNLAALTFAGRREALLAFGVRVLAHGRNREMLHAPLVEE